MSFSSGLIRLAGIRAIARISYNASGNSNFVRANSTAIHDISRTKLETLAERLKTTEHVPEIHTYYPALVGELTKARKTSPSDEKFSPLDQSQLTSILEALSASGRPADLQRVEEILSDMPALFNLEPNIEVHTAIIRALIKHGNVHTVHRWLLNMPSRPGHFTPTLDQYHIFLEACMDLASFKFMRNLVLTMRQSGCKPSNETFKVLIRARWKMANQEEKVPHIIVFSTIIDDMQREGLRHDPSVSALLYDSYVERGLTAYAEQIQTLYQSRFPDVQSPQKQQKVEWNVKLSRTAQARGVKAAIAQFRSFEQDGCIASPATIRSILRHSRHLSDLRLLSEEFGMETTAAHWSILISNSVRTGHISDAMSIYEETKKAGIVPDAALVGPLIKALCQSTFKPPSDDAIDQALAIYKDLVQVAPASSTPELPKRSYTDHSVGPDADIYQTLLRGLASSTNLDKYFPIAKSLMDDMESRGISTSDSLTASSIIVLLMRSSPTPSDALDVYRSLHSALDEKGYEIVLNAFCKLSFGQDIQVPSLSSYFEIVRDMRRAGLEITVEVYTIILHQLGVVATKIKDPNAGNSPNLHEQLIKTTRRTHDLLTLDAAVSPDAHVWNQLMDTYQRLGCFGDSYRVWDMMYLSGRFDHVSVSIILDACGYAGAWHVAKSICTKLFNDPFSFNLHNWNTWLECLCRLGRLNDAVKVACLEMGKEQNTVAPNVESARILIKFSRKTNQQAEVLSRIQRYLPDLWSTLPEELRQP